MNIILFIQDISPDSSFHYSRKQGGDLIFQYNRQRQRHEAIIPLAQWREDSFFQARILLDQNLVVPIFFDVEDSASCVAEVPAEPQPTREVAPEPAEPEEAPAFLQEAPPVKRAYKRKSLLSPAQREAAMSSFSEQSETQDSTPSFIPA